MSQCFEELAHLLLITEFIEADAESSGLGRRHTIGENPQVESRLDRRCVQQRCMGGGDGDGVEAVGLIDRDAWIQLSSLQKIYHFQ
jgi:hypothetical protein